MLKDVHEYVEQCHYCTLAKRRPAARQPVGPTMGQYPFDVLYVDLLDMAETHDYNAQTKTGATKLVVFIDSLSRWVEAIPVHSAPTSEQILDIFMEHIVSRHGTPRHIVADAGSNLGSQLCKAIYAATGVDLSVSAAEHHEAVGTVERFHQTLVNMARATDEGGKYWLDHLPFLLMSYRATPNRVTKASPAVILYGREMRLPAQLGHSDAHHAAVSGVQIDKSSFFSIPAT
mmetsp:Transcript_31110/g.53228  ORF Transcript_31110/g.53228 Transcript_31110/m.53228 type:complete len:231 (-) Transcript_31110:671-1363(-)